MSQQPDEELEHFRKRLQALTAYAVEAENPNPTVINDIITDMKAWRDKAVREAQLIALESHDRLKELWEQYDGDMDWSEFVDRFLNQPIENQPRLESEGK